MDLNKIKYKIHGISLFSLGSFRGVRRVNKVHRAPQVRQGPQDPMALTWVSAAVNLLRNLGSSSHCWTKRGIVQADSFPAHSCSFILLPAGGGTWENTPKQKELCLKSTGADFNHAVAGEYLFLCYYSCKIDHICSWSIQNSKAHSITMWIFLFFLKLNTRFKGAIHQIPILRWL